jgi:enamine deaminase RidA (YjgF/YER057c/UK114 family)
MLKIICDGCEEAIEGEMPDVGQIAFVEAILNEARLRVRMTITREDADAAANLCVKCVKIVLEKGALGPTSIISDADVPDVTPGWWTHVVKRRMARGRAAEAAALETPPAAIDDEAPL